MEPRQAARLREVMENNIWSRISEEEAEEDDDHATLQDCLDRQKKVSTVRNTSKRVALTPLDEEDCRRPDRKKSKGIQELLAANPAVPSVRSGDPPLAVPSHSRSKQPRNNGPVTDAVEAVGTDLHGGKKRRLKNKKKKLRRSVDDIIIEGGGGDGALLLHDAEFQNYLSESAEDLTTSESSRKLFIRVAKVELVDGRRHGSTLTPSNQSGPRTGIHEFPDYGTDLLTVEDVFLPGNGYHTCGDAENCSKIPCLELVLDHLDKMSEEQLKAWYKAILGEVFASRNGEKVRGRLRRMIRCKVKEIIKSELSDSTVSSQSWRSSSETFQPCGDTSPPMKAGDDPHSPTDSPGSKLSASNAGGGSVEAEDAVCSGKTLPMRVTPASSSEISRELTFQLPASRDSFSMEASGNSSVDDPEPALPPVTARITRSKAREKSGTDQEHDEDKAPCVDGFPELYQSSLNRRLPDALKQSELRGISPPVSLTSGAADCDALSDQRTEGATTEKTSAYLSCNDSFSAEEVHKEVSSSADCDLNGLPGEGAAKETTAAYSRERSFPVEVRREYTPSADCSLSVLPVESAPAGTTAVVTRSRKKSFAVEQVPGDGLPAANLSVHDLLVEVVGIDMTTVTTRSRKKRAFVAADKVVGGFPSDCDTIVAETTAAIPSRKKCSTSEGVHEEVSLLDDCSADGRQVDGVAVLSTAGASSSSKKREIVAAEKVRGEDSSPADCRASGLPVEGASAEPTIAATRSRKNSYFTEKALGKLPSCSDFDARGLLVESAVIETIAAATRSRKKRELLVAEKVLGEACSPGGWNVSNPSAEAASEPTTAATRSRKKIFALEKVPGEVSSSVGCAVGGLSIEIEARETPVAGSRLCKRGGFVTAEKVLVEVPSSADPVMIVPPAEAGAADTTIAPTHSCQNSFVVQKVVGEVTTSVGGDVNSLPDRSTAVETPVSTAWSSHKKEPVAAEEVLEEIYMSADCEVSGLSVEDSGVDTTTIATLSRNKNLAVEKVTVEVSLSAERLVNGTLGEVGAAGATAVATRSRTNGMFDAADKVPEGISALADSDIDRPLVEKATLKLANADSTPSKKREPVAAKETLGEVLSSSDLDCSERLHLAVEEHMQGFQHSRRGGDSGERGVPSLSEVVMKLLSDRKGKPSVSCSEFIPVDGQQSSGRLVRHSDTHPSLSGSTMAALEKAWLSNLMSVAAPAKSVIEKIIVEMGDPSFEGTQLSNLSPSQREPVVSVCKQDVVLEETGEAKITETCRNLKAKDCLSSTSCVVTRLPWEEEFSCDCEKTSGPFVTTSDVDGNRSNAPSDLDAEDHMGEQIEQEPVTEVVQLQPSTSSSSSLVVCCASSSGSISEIAPMDCKFNTEHEEVPIGDDDVRLPRDAEITKSSKRFAVADFVSFKPPSAGTYSENHIQLAARGLRLCEEIHDSVELKHSRTEGEDMDTESGDEILFEKLSAEKVSSLWPVRDEKESYVFTQTGHEMEDVVGRKLGCGIHSTTTSRSVKRQLMKCHTVTFDDFSLPRVWRDAGEFLEELDNVYMMLDTGRSSSSYSLGKRKHHNSDLDDYRSECSDAATQCDYEPPRTRQRVEFVGAQETCVVSGKLPAEIGDVGEAGGDLEQFWRNEEEDVSNGLSKFVDSHTSVNVAGPATCEEVQYSVSSHYHQESWIDDQRRDGESVVNEESVLLENKMAMYENRSQTPFSTEVCLSPPLPCVGGSFLVEPPLCDSPASQSTSDEEGSPESMIKSDASLDLMACERLVQEADPEDYKQSSELLAARKVDAMMEDNHDDSQSPPSDLPPIRLKLPSGRARLIASVLPDSKLRSVWRYSEAMVLDQNPRTISAPFLSPNSSDEETGDSIREQGSNISAPSEAGPSQKLSLVLSPTSPESSPSPRHDSWSGSTEQDNISSPGRHVPPPCTTPCPKGILKSSLKCGECVKLRFKTKAASDFVASQMKTFGEVAGRLTREIQDLQWILETQVSGAAKGLQESDALEDNVKAISKSREIQQSAEKNLSLLLRDCKRFCKLTYKRPQRRIVFADEAGKELCHVKTFQSPPAVVRPLWDIL